MYSSSSPFDQLHALCVLIGYQQRYCVHANVCLDVLLVTLDVWLFRRTAPKQAYVTDVGDKTLHDVFVMSHVCAGVRVSKRFEAER